jgi:hypothetical protein
LGRANIISHDRKMFTYMGALNLKNQALTPIELGKAEFDDAAKIATGVSDPDSLY